MTTTEAPPEVLTPVEEARRRFESDTTEHTMDVLHDDGLYKHLRFSNNGSSFYYYDLITWPGHLTIAGDMGTWTFARTRDMFGFFRGNPDRPLSINPDYWAEKLQAGASGGRDHAREYDERSFARQVNAHVEDHIRDHEWPDEPAAALRTQIELDVTNSWCGGGFHEESARELLHHFKFEHTHVVPASDEAATALGAPTLTEVYRFAFDADDTCEWSFREYTVHFLWCCWAIAHGIRAYDGHVLAAAETGDAFTPADLGNLEPGA